MKMMLRVLPSRRQKRLLGGLILAVAVIEPLATAPQAVAIYAKHSAASVSILTWAMYLLFALAWGWYGLAERQRALVISSAIFVVLDAAVLVGALIYGGSW